MLPSTWDLTPTVQCVNLGCLEHENCKYLGHSISGPGRKDCVTASGEGYYDAKWENVRVSDDGSSRDLTADDLHSHADSHAASEGDRLASSECLRNAAFTPGGDPRARVLPQSRK